MTTRDEQRRWLSTTKAWQGERDAVGLERVIDSFELTDATVTVGQIDLRRWTRTEPEIAKRLREIRAIIEVTNRMMMQWIQEQTRAAEKEDTP